MVRGAPQLTATVGQPVPSGGPGGGAGGVPGGAALRLAGVTRRFGPLVALDDVSFEVASGRMVGFVGRNGAGKTTAMRIIMGLLEPHEGDVRWHGERPTQDARRHFGYMPEERGLYPRMRVGDQLRWFARMSGFDAQRAARSTDRWMGRLGIAERAVDRVEALSLGNQQRVQLAAALVHEPELLVLDEPFSGLDPVGTDVLGAVLAEEVDRGVAVLFSSHQLELVERLCHAVTILEGGRVVASGPVDELRDERTARRIRVVVAGAPEGWHRDVPGVVTAERSAAGGVVVELTEGADSGELLDAARAVGTVEHFSVERPTLAELFRRVVPT